MTKLNKPHISKNDLKVISKRRHDHPDKKVRLRLNILWFTSQCDSAPQIAKFVGASTRHVFKIIEMYKTDGLKCVTEVNHFKQQSKLEGFSSLIREEFEKKPPASVKEAKIRIKELTGIKRSLTQIRVFIKKLGMRLLKTGAIPMGKNETSLEEKTKKQREFVSTLLDPLLKQAEQGKRKVLFMDACHIQLACILGFLWCFSKRYIKALPLRGRINVIGACSPYGEDIICDITQESVDANAIAFYLFKVRNKIKHGKITLVLDNAQYQKTEHVLKTAQDLGIELLYLPVASPNLNIVERLWKFAKKTFVANNIFESLEGLKTHLINCFSSLKKKYKSDLRSLLTPNLQYFDGTTQFLAA
jgi:transposase